jgi:signal transduction histidine kinase
MPAVWVDSVQIEQVILNLVRNGLDAMRNPAPSRGVLSIETSMVGEAAIEVAVCDAGEGLAPEVADKIFDPFFTTKSDGMGMGLAISRTIIEAHGGRLWMTKNSDRGATFHFTLPLGDKETDAT